MPILNGNEILFGAQINIGTGSDENFVTKQQLRNELKTVANSLTGETIPVVYDLIFDTFDDIEVGMSMIRFATPIDVTKHKTTVAIKERLLNFMYRYINTISEDDVVIDSGWIWMDTTTNIVFERGGQVMFQFRKADGTQCTEDDIWLIENAVSVSVEGGFRYLDDEIEFAKANIDKLSAKVTEYESVLVTLPFELEYGSVSSEDGSLTSNHTRIRFTAPIDVTKRTTVTILANEEYEYGYSQYDSEGNYGGITYDWISMESDTEIVFEEGGQVIFKFRRIDNMNCTDDDIAVLTDLITIITEGGIVQKVDILAEKVNQIGDISTALDELHAYAQNLIGGI